MRLRDEGWPITLIVAMFATAAVTWSFLPETLPTDWSHGVPGGFAGRAPALLFMPVIALAFYVTGVLVSRDHERDDADHVWWWFRTIMTVCFATIYVFLQIGFWGSVPRWSVLIGVLVTGLGCLRSFGPNSLIGVRTTWALSSDRSWRRSNRLLRQLSLGLGPVIIALGLLDPPFAFEIAVGAVIGVLAWVTWYSYVQWHRDQGTPHASSGRSSR